MKKVALLEISDWEKETLQKFPEFLAIADLYSESLSSENIEKFQDYAIISPFINSRFTPEVITKLPHLRYITTRSTGFDHIDVDYCREKKILVSNVPAYGSHTVAEYTFALLLCLVRKIYDAYHRVREEGNFSLENLRGRELFGKTLGVIGTGRIGTNVVKIAKGFQMKILAYDRYPDKEKEKQLGFTYVSLEQLLQESDIITLHVPYNSSTHHLLNSNNIPLIKKGAFVINTARGGIIETEALYQALKSGQIAGAALDVLEEEKEIKEEQELLLKDRLSETGKLKNVVLNHILVDLDNVLVTPHNAFNTEEALHNIIVTTIDNINSFLQGKPQNLVS